jgi:hypothetical protein
VRLIIYSSIGLLIATSYYVPQLHGFFAENPEFDGYRMIAINVALARLLIEAIVGRVRWKKIEAQLHGAVGAQQDLAALRAEEQSAKKTGAEAVAGLKLSVNAAERLTAELTAELAAVKAAHEKLQMGFSDLSHKHREMEAMPATQAGSTTGDEAINLLSLLQQRGRFIDFVMEDITSVPDQQVGAAARVVQQGCSRVLKDLFNIKPVNDQGEGHRIVIADDADMSNFRLVGRVKDEPPYEGTLLHRGWQTDKIDMPRISGRPKMAGPRLISPAEIELT